MQVISRRAWGILLGGWLLLLGVDAKALLMEFRPASQTVIAGSTVAADLWIVGSNPNLGIGAYDVTLDFDPAFLAFDSVSLSPVFGATLGPFITPASGAVSIADVSLETPADLLSLQTASDFVLGSFRFHTVSAGMGSLDISGVTLGDVNGDRVAVDSLGSSSITATQNSVPEPTTLLLLGIGFAGLEWLRRSRRKQTNKYVFEG